MAAKIRFLYSNLWTPSTTTVTASGAASGLPATNSQNTDRAAVWRSDTTSADKWLKADLGSAQTVTCCALANVVPHAAGAVKLQWSANGSTGWTDVDTFAAQDTQRKVTYLFFTSLSKRYWRVLLAAGAGSAYVEIGYVHLGTYIETSINVTVPLDIRRADPSVIVRAVDGQRTTSTRTKFQLGAWHWTNAPEADLSLLQAMYDTVGVGLPIFAVLDTTLSWAAWLQHLTEEIQHSPQEVRGRYDIAVGWEEAR